MNDENTCTEEQAMKKWCPFSRVRRSGFHLSYNRRPDNAPPDGSYCIGKKCMLFKNNNPNFINTYYCGLTRGEQ